MSRDKKPTCTAHVDLHNTFPADGFLNLRRGNHPLGQVATNAEAELATANGAKLARCHCPTNDKHCIRSPKFFEPPDEFQREFARDFFYMSTRYRQEEAKPRQRGECCSNAAVTGFDIRPWLEETLRAWHEGHPPKERERERNDAVDSPLCWVAIG